MLQDKSNRNSLITHGFLLAVEGDDEIITPEQIANKLGDSLAWTEGIGVVDIDYIGKIETIEEDEVTN